MTIQERARELAEKQNDFNKKVRKWAQMTQGQLIRNVHNMNIMQRKELFTRLTTEKAKFSKGDGEIFRVQMPNTIGGIMTARGEGGGNTSNRIKKDWYGTTMDIMLEALGDTTAQYKADASMIEIKTRM